MVDGRESKPASEDQPASENEPSSEDQPASEVRLGKDGEPTADHRADVPPVAGGDPEVGAPRPGTDSTDIDSTDIEATDAETTDREHRDSYLHGSEGGTGEPEPVAYDPREQFGGLKAGAVFFGWLVSVALGALLAGVAAAIAAGVSSDLEVTQFKQNLDNGTISLGAAITLVVIVVIGYFAGGYVAGRLCRFDGGRQGFAVWVLGLIVTIVVTFVVAEFGAQSDVFDRLDLPSIPTPDETINRAGLITLAVALVATLIASFLGGKLGKRFHAKIDRAHSAAVAGPVGYSGGSSGTSPRNHMM